MQGKRHSDAILSDVNMQWGKIAIEMREKYPDYFRVGWK